MNHFKLLGTFDQAPALADIAEFPLWDWLNVRRLFPLSQHYDTSDIILRANSVVVPQSFDIFMNGLEMVDYFPSFVMRDVMALAHRLALGERLGRVMLTRLPSGKSIGAHIDQGAYAEAHDRYHFCLTTNDGCVFHSGGESQHMAAGEIWWFDNRVLHSVDNFGETDRVHLIVDVRK